MTAPIFLKLTIYDFHATKQTSLTIVTFITPKESYT